MEADVDEDDAVGGIVYVRGCVRAFVSVAETVLCCRMHVRAIR